MVDVFTTLRARLTSYAGLSALTSTRWYPGYLPQGAAKPAGYYEQVDVEPFSAMGTDAGLEATFVDLVIVADSYSSLLSVIAQVRQAVQRWSTSTGFIVHDTYIEGQSSAHVDETAEEVATISIKIIHQTGVT